jgi:uncharacterized protein with PIN domain
MVIDTSAIICILLNEPEARQFITAIATAPQRLMSTVTALEVTLVH